MSHLNATPWSTEEIERANDPEMHRKFDLLFDEEMMNAHDLSETDIEDLHQRFINQFVTASSFVDVNGRRLANYSGLILSVGWGLACGLAKVISHSEYRLEIEMLKDKYVFVKGGK